MSEGPTHPITVFPARKVLTMTPSLPEASAVAVADRRIVAVGSLDSMRPWLNRHEYVVDERLSDKVVLPGFIDPHVHPSLPAVLTQFPFLAPEDWNLPTGRFSGATTPDAFRTRLRELVDAHPDWSVPFVAWGYHPLWHGSIGRPELTAMFGTRPVILWHRSFHELIANDGAIDWMGLSEQQFADLPEVDWERGRFWENGAMALVGASRLPQLLFEPARYGEGMANFFRMVHLAGVTTCLDMGVGSMGNPENEIRLINRISREIDAPSRIVLTPLISDFLARGVSPQEAVAAVAEWAQMTSGRVGFDHHFKLMMDGAIFSGMAQFGYPGYLDGHTGMWMAPLQVTRTWAEVFWREGYQLHAHTVGDLSAEALIDLVRHLQWIHPRIGHRTVLEHFGYTTEEQNLQMRELGMVVSANPYYHYLLSDIYSSEWLGSDRGAELVRLGSLERLGVPFGLHSDCPMAPLAPLTLAWVAARRITINGNLNCAQERISLHAALRAITIDAAWIMRKENDLGSIRAGKYADFTVLEDDPHQVGVDGLKDLPIWGTVFEGQVRSLPS
ncbi:amidohydrolase [Mycobacterium marinum]|uniref:amidohydrolase n=1 Tax=Mycobacterium marinum TaxID=1781 RepID=UPI0035647D9C